MLDNISYAVTYAVDDSFDNDKFMKLRLKVCHDSKSLHNTIFPKDALAKAESSIANSAILAHVIEDDEGKLDFGGHDFIIEEDKYNEGQYRKIYLEQPIGVIPESNNYEIVDEDGISYVYCDAYIWKGYSNYCVDILENSDRIKLSMEVEFLDYHYSKPKDSYIITDFKYEGITLLGTNVRPAMQNSGATITNYSTTDDNARVITVEDLRNELSKVFSIADKEQEKGVIGMDKETIQNVLAEYGISEADLGFEINEDMTVEELRAKIGELNSNANDVSDKTEADDAEGNSVEKPASTESEDSSNKEPEGEENGDSDNDEPVADNSANTNVEPVKGETNSEDTKKISFSMSDEDKRTKLYKALGEVSDDEYWIIQTYDNYFVAQAWLDGKFYKIGYTKTENEVAVDSEFVEVFAEFVTEAERNELDKMRNGYAELETEVEELRRFKDEAESNARAEAVNAIFEVFDEKLSECEDYANLKENNSEYSVEEVEEKCYAMLGRISSTFSVDANSVLTRVGFSCHDDDNKVTNKPYNGLFDLLKED